MTDQRQPNPNGVDPADLIGLFEEIVMYFLWLKFVVLCVMAMGSVEW